MSPSSSRTAPGSISLRSGARAPPRLLVPIGEELAVRRMFHAATLPPRPARRDKSVPLSRTRIPVDCFAGGALQRPCREPHLPARRGRLCAVNVKLTMRFPTGVGLLVSAHSNSSPVFSRAGEVVTQGGVKQFGRRAGRGGDVPPGSLRGKIGTNEGGLSQSPPFFHSRFFYSRFYSAASRKFRARCRAGTATLRRAVLAKD